MLTFVAVNDATVLLRDIAGDAAQKAATKINPSEDQLNQIDEPADDNTWHDVPNLSPANLKAQAKEQYSKNKPLSRNDLQQAAGDATQAAHPSGSRDPTDAAAQEADARQQGTDSGMDPNAGANAAKDKLKGTMSQNIPDENKEKAQNLQDNARAQRDRVQNHLKSKVPKERREQTIFRLKKMIVEIQSHSDCKLPSHPNNGILANRPLDQQAIETLLSLAEQYGGHGMNVAQQSAGTVKGAHSDDALTTAETDLKVCYRCPVRKQRNADFNKDSFGALRQLYIGRRPGRCHQPDVP